MSLQELKEKLGIPYYEDEDILIYSGDCLHLLDKVDPASIPLTVTSPPYNIGKEYEKILKTDDYVTWSSEWISKIHRITSENGAFWLNLGYIPLDGKAKAIPLPYLIWQHVPFFLIQEVIWNYAAGVAGRLFFSPRNEKFLWYVKDSENYTFNLDDVRDPNVKYPNQKKNGKLKCNPLGKNPTDVWQIAKVTSGKNRSSKERTAHPAQFPIELVKRIILASSNTGDIVLDPFLGSGSTLEAAIRTGREAVGIDIEPQYLEIAIDRIKKVREQIILEKSQKSLFDELSPRENDYKLQAG
ncbi:MAG: site-specific DNA-methyltransferase [Robiginitomaculum sp.]|nr:site-specific DNA-methyltransferase [Robiginitomaculum sp.]